MSKSFCVNIYASVAVIKGLIVFSAKAVYFNDVHYEIMQLAYPYVWS